MSDKPTTTPDWTATGVTPSAGEKSNGFAAGDRLPADYVDWFFENASNWITWLAEGIFTRASLSDDSPVLATSDQDGRVRHYIGAEGYCMGPVTECHYHWFRNANVAQDDNVSLGDPFYATHFNATATTVYGVVPPRAGFNSLMLEVNSIGFSGNQGAVFSQLSGSGTEGTENLGTVVNLDDVVMVMEGVFTTDVSGTSNMEVYWGFNDLQQNSSPDPTFINGSDTAVMFFLDLKTSGAFRAQCGTIGGNHTDVLDTPTSIAANTYYTLRVEFHGANTPLGVDNTTAPVARFFIDGTLVHERTTGDLPPNAAYTEGMSPVVAVKVTSAGSNTQVHFGPIRYSYNHVLSPDVPS